MTSKDRQERISHLRQCVAQTGDHFSEAEIAIMNRELLELTQQEARDESPEKREERLRAHYSIKSNDIVEPLRRLLTADTVKTLSSWIENELISAHCAGICEGFGKTRGIFEENQ